MRLFMRFVGCCIFFQFVAMLWPNFFYWFCNLQNSESIKKIYDKKCAQLSHQFAKDGNARQVDKTRATIKELYSRLMVGIEVLYSNSKIIEKLRDEELQPQLLELLQG
jgi:hypothetical protein